MRRYVLAILGILAVIGTLGAIKGAQIAKLIGFGKQMEKDGPPPEAVGTATAKVEGWEGTITGVGSVASTKGVALSADVPGTVQRILFESGQTVKAGQVLVELDSSVERAQLATAISRRELAKTTQGRSKALVQSGAISAARAMRTTRRCARRSRRSRASRLRSRRRRSAPRSPASSGSSRSTSAST